MIKNSKKPFIDGRRQEDKLLLDALCRILGRSMQFIVRCLNDLQENIPVSDLA